MKTIRLNHVDVPVNITKKNNKHTYYYFKKKGYIQVNLAAHQSERQALKYIKKHPDVFLHKYHEHCISNRDSSRYYLWGVPYQIETHTHNRVDIDHDEKILYVPCDDVDQCTALEQFEQMLMKQELQRLINLYQDNEWVDISGVTYRMKSMSSRHGSCNKAKRNISLNLELIHQDKPYMEYVFLHEICHLVHANHSKTYYSLLERICPNYKAIRKDLQKAW